MRSAVNIQGLPQAIVPDNRHVIGVAKGIGEDIKEGVNKRRANKLVEEIMAAQNAGVPQAVRAQAMPNLDQPQDPQAALQSQAVELQKQKQVQQAQVQAEQAQKAIVQRSNMQRMLNDPATKANLIKLQGLDPQKAKFVFTMMASADEADRLAVAKEAQREQNFLHNAAAIMQHDIKGNKGGKEFKAFVADAIRQEHARGADTSRLQELYRANPDEAIALIRKNQALANITLENPELQKSIVVADGSQLINPITGELVAENKKDVDPNAAGSLAERRRANDLRADELENAKNKIPANVENNIVKSQEAAFDSRNNSGHLETLAQEFERTDLDSGSSAIWTERIKEISGQEDEVTQLRKKYTRLKNTQALKSLPPGAASDSDVALAMEGFLGATADPKQIASFLRGLAKMEQINADFHEFRANYMSEEKSAAGFGKAWREHSKDAYKVNEGLSDDDLFGKYGIK